MHREATQLAVEKEVAQGAPDGSKRQFAPWNFRLVEQAHLEALRPGTEIEIEQAGAKHHVELVDMRQADHRVQRPDVDTRLRFLGGLALGPGGNGLAVLQESRRQGPQATAWFDRALAQQHPL